MDFPGFINVLFYCSIYFFLQLVINFSFLEQKHTPSLSSMMIIEFPEFPKLKVAIAESNPNRMNNRLAQTNRNIIKIIF